MTNKLTIHAIFRGVPADILQEMITLGIAGNKTEAIRVALLAYAEKYFKGDNSEL